MAIGWIGRQTSGGGNIQMPPANYKVASRYQNTLGVDLIVDKTWTHWGIGGGSGFHAKMIVYSDTPGSPPAPNALLQTSNERTTTEVSLPTPFTYGAPWTWPDGEYRWLGVIGDSMMSNNQQDGATTNGVAYNPNTYTSGPSDPFGSPLYVDYQYRMWAEGYDASHKLGRIAIQDGRDSLGTANFAQYNPCFEKFTLGGVASPMGIATAVSVTAIKVYSLVTIAATVHCSIYDNNVTTVGGTPRTMLEGCARLGQTASLTSIVPGWNTFTFTTPIVLAAGDYWLGIICDTSGVTQNFCGWGGSLVGANATGTSGYFPYPANIPVWGGPSGATYPYLSDNSPVGMSIYAEYDLGGDVGALVIRSSLWITPGLWID